MTNLRNYGDERILEFDRLAKDWELAPVGPHNDAHNNLFHAEFWRRKAKSFREQHERDPHWRDRKDYPLIKIGKAYEARNGGVFTIKGIVPYDDPHRKEGYLFVSTVGTYYSEGGRGTQSYNEHWSDLVRLLPPLNS